MAEWTGLEPATPCVIGSRYCYTAKRLNYRFMECEKRNGGMDGTRTRDPLRDRQPVLQYG